MDTSSNEATGSRRAPPTVPPFPPVERIRGCIANTMDCLRRALDGLDVDQHHQPHWPYVVNQLNRAASTLNSAEAVAVAEWNGAKDDADNAACANPSSARDPFLQKILDAAAERGAS